MLDIRESDARTIFHVKSPLRIASDINLAQLRIAEYVHFMVAVDVFDDIAPELLADDPSDPFAGGSRVDRLGADAGLRPPVDRGGSIVH